MSTTRARTTPGTNTGSFAPHARPEADDVTLPVPTGRFTGDVTVVHGPPDELADEEGGSTVFAVENGERIGHLHYEKSGRGVVIHHMWTDHAHRGRGVASRLMEDLVARSGEGTFFHTSEFSGEGQGFADDLARRTGVVIADDSSDDDDEDWW